VADVLNLPVSETLCRTFRSAEDKYLIEVNYRTLPVYYWSKGTGVTAFPLNYKKNMTAVIKRLINYSLTYIVN